MDGRRIIEIRILIPQDRTHGHFVIALDRTEIDKRQYPRVACEIDSAYQDLGSQHPETQSETQARDLSEGGVRFRVSHFIPVHNRLFFRLRIPNQRPIEALAQPAWIREIPSVDQYEIGAKFLSLSDEDRRLIRRYIQNF